MDEAGPPASLARTSLVLVGGLWVLVGLGVALLAILAKLEGDPAHGCAACDHTFESWGWAATAGVGVLVAAAFGASILGVRKDSRPAHFAFLVLAALIALAVAAFKASGRGGSGAAWWAVLGLSLLPLLAVLAPGNRAAWMRRPQPANGWVTAAAAMALVAYVAFAFATLLGADEETGVPIPRWAAGIGLAGTLWGVALLLRGSPRAPPVLLVAAAGPVLVALLAVLPMVVGAPPLMLAVLATGLKDNLLLVAAVGCAALQWARDRRTLAA